jgi:hypothetical protein
MVFNVKEVSAFRIEIRCVRRWMWGRRSRREHAVGGRVARDVVGARGTG